MSERPFLIAGGGIAGLAAALGLSRAGVSTRLFEQSPAFEEVGAGLQMSPNGVSALRRLGAWDAVEPSCVIPSEIHVRDGVSGSLLQRIRLGKPFEERFGAPYRVCHRADLLSGLLATARSLPSVALETGARITTAHIGEAPGLALADGRTVPGTAIIGADGIRSTLRSLICGTVDPVDRGHTIFRALIPLKDVPPEIEADCVTLWLYPGGHVVHYPVSNWRSFNIVAALDVRDSDEGWNTLAQRRELIPRFSRACDALMLLLEAPLSWLKWQGADLPVLPRWSKDNALLIGDAAHATLPYLAQGAVMALEDACVLSREMGRGLAVASAFINVENVRRERTARIQAQSRRMGRIYHASGPLALARNVVLRYGGASPALRQMEWIYRWKP
jgi:salicylate hydroxylase